MLLNPYHAVWLASCLIPPTIACFCKIKGSFHILRYNFKIMRAVIQRVSKASVTVDEEITGSIKQGLLVFVGIEDADEEEDIEWLSGKIVNLRIFNDEAGVMNKSVLDVEGDILLVSQFTLHAATKKGNRPSYIKASKPDIAIPKYESFKARLVKDLGKSVPCGIFGADMKVELLNDGPVTILIDTKNKE
jgi:D-tyrosyl-tRNA(Tyr) deacylase